MKLPPHIKVYGDKNFRGPCPREAAEQISFFNHVRDEYPDTVGKIAFHARNEGKRSFNQVMKEAAEGATPGVSDIIIPGGPTFVCELKRKDHTKSHWQPGQMEYLEISQEAGAFAFLALGWEAAVQALDDWLALTSSAP